MKKPWSLLAAGLLVLLSTAGFARENGGIYVTVADFEHSRPQYGQSYHINTDVLFRPTLIKFANAREAFVLDKSEVYGYRDAKAQDHRFYEGSEYTVLTTAGICLYSRVVTVAEGKLRERKTVYYFSVSAGSALQTLSLYHLKQAYAANETFVQQLEQRFRYDNDLVQYNNSRKEYAVAGLLQQLAPAR